MEGGAKGYRPAFGACLDGRQPISGDRGGRGVVVGMAKDEVAVLPRTVADPSGELLGNNTLFSEVTENSSYHIRTDV